MNQNFNMEQIIKNTTEKLKNGYITTDEANKFLMELFGIIKRNSLTKIGFFALGIMMGIMIGYTIALMLFIS
jgi:hypothetical protein